VEDIISSIETSLHKNTNLIKYVSLVTASTVKTLSNFVLKPEFPSMNIKDIRILKNLKKDGSITITEADKSNTLVVMNTEDYESKLKSLLNDEKTYKKLSYNPTDSFTNKFKNKLKCLKDEGKITPQLYYKCLPRSSLCPKLYGLP
jgi:capsular polysaccharide biosynthesis protein